VLNTQLVDDAHHLEFLNISHSALCTIFIKLNKLINLLRLHIKYHKTGKWDY